MQARLQTFVDSGQLGIFANAYWGHPAYKLPPEGNLLAVAHYLEALDWQREVIKFQAILGGKNPHPQTYLVGGMAIPVDPASSAAINADKIAQLKTQAAQAQDFVNAGVLPRPAVGCVASTRSGQATAAPRASISPSATSRLDNSGSLAALFLPRGIVRGNNLAAPPEPLDQNLIQEYVTRSWYSYGAGDGVALHPSVGETQPNYTGPQADYEFLDTDGKYSWLKAPRYNDAAMEVGPLARMVVAYAAGHAARARVGRRAAGQAGAAGRRRSSPRSAAWPRGGSRRW